MEKYHEIMEAMACCSTDGFAVCREKCPYKDKVGDGVSCRQKLLIVAMHALETEKEQADDLREETEMLAAENRSLREALTHEKMQVLLIKESRDDAEMERNRLYTECNELREELKNRPEVGFDADTFDACLAKINAKTGAAKYWRGFADGLKWWFREYFKDNGSCTELSEALMREKMEEGGDDV